jgi:hypothetical protein
VENRNYAMDLTKSSLSEREMVGVVKEERKSRKIEADPKMVPPLVLGPIFCASPLSFLQRPSLVLPHTPITTDLPIQ